MQKNVFITGGSRGIGRGIAECFLKAGYAVVINGTRPENEVQNTIQELEQLGGPVVYCQGNIGRAEDRQAIAEKVTAVFGYLNVLVNNAGIAPPERNDILEATESSYDQVLEVNLKGPYFLTQIFANLMVKQKQNDPSFLSTIINVSSVSATVPSVNRGEYCISKAGIAMTTKLWAVRLAEFDIPVYEIQPGIIKTDMTAGVVEKYDRLIEAGLTLQKRWGKPEDIGVVALAMAEGSLPYATGQVVQVDGGLTQQKL
ncbi:MAG: 3-ketoacyl-ACP reductase [Flavobacteriaceae bacterium]|jgi:NAD(P)-dependent dehydrogenase (short-subunit alcohol dehydrogenase family)